MVNAREASLEEGKKGRNIKDMIIRREKGKRQGSLKGEKDR